MISPEQIPDEAVEEAKSSYTASIYKGQATAREYHAAMLDAIAAALNAWPGRKIHPTHEGWPQWPHIILPLPTEPRHD